MTIEMQLLDGAWVESLVRDFWRYPGDTEGEKVAWLNQLSQAQLGRSIWRQQAAA